MGVDGVTDEGTRKGSHVVSRRELVGQGDPPLVERVLRYGGSVWTTGEGTAHTGPT